MVRKELIQNSPLRILEKTTHGGVGKGNIGVIASRKGVGKTACLVHIATDQLFQDNHVIHISFSSNTEHIISWYEEIFTEIANRRNLEHAMEVHDEIIKNRVIMNFNQDTAEIEQVIASIKSLVSEGHFSADTIIVDGYDFTKATPDNLKAFKAAAEDLKVQFWFSATLPEDNDALNAKGIPVLLEQFLPSFGIVVNLKSDGNVIHLELKKDHDATDLEDMHLKLDPKVLLITKE